MPGRNRLGDEASPYLRQHAENPVHWQPWDEEALAEARERDVPIFLSIGYSACHWCHVMEEESFRNVSIAEVLNERFVPVKVDREERPDVDSVYMTVSQLVTGRGGWPLSVWLTPEGEPFHVGTYFPPEPRQGMPGFEDLCRDIADSWADPEERAELEERAQRWTAALEDELEGTDDAGATEADRGRGDTGRSWTGRGPAPDTGPGDGSGATDESPLSDAGAAALREADREQGGFGRSGPKFPQPGRLHVLLRARERSGREGYREVVAETLDAMADGGMYDQLGGGFHRYATDRSWTVPHFEKMLYDQAELVRAYLEGYRATGDDRYAEVAAETLAFVERELTHPEGGFYSTLDARSAPPEGWPAGDAARDEGAAGEEADGTDSDEGDVEGAFYVWTPEQVRDALGEADAELFCERYGVDAAGNFEHGTTVLTRAATVEELASERDGDPDDLAERLADLRRAAFEAREDRPRPRRDEKVLAGWNGLMISAFAEASLTLDPDLAGTAEAALAFVRDRLWDPEDRRLSRRFKDGDVGVRGYLEDYAFLGRGALDCYQATGDVEHLAFALDLARVVEAEFYDAEDGTLYFTPASGESLVARPQELGDSSTPSSLGVAVQLLAALDHFAPHERFGDVADDVLGSHRGRLASNPLGHATLALAADDRAVGPIELTVAAAELPADWREKVGGAYLPGRLLARRPPTEDGLDAWLSALDLEAAPPVWAGREARDGRPTAYLCRARTCSPPQHDLAEALSWADRLSPGGDHQEGDDADSPI